MKSSGPLADGLIEELSEFAAFRDWRAGKITREQYIDGLMAQAAQIEASIGPRNLRLLAARYPSDFDRQADEFFATLRSEGFLSDHPPVAPFEAFRERVRAAYDHGEHRTAIQPDEARLLYLISMALRPRRMIAIGSYYGYWAVWAMPGVVAGDGQAILMDPNAAVCALAERNFKALGLGDRTSVIAKKAEEVFDEWAPGSLDLVLLDANGGRDSPAAYRGKGIYAFMARGVYEKMREGALLVAHNDYLPGVGDNRLSHDFVERLSRPIADFHAFCDGHFRRRRVLATPDGFGVYQK